MEPFAIKQAAFLTSVGQSGAAYPEALPCEIAIVGRSNVGKSSLINCICRNAKLARTSQTPGKTRLINYFLLNRGLYLVDLPGYGFAKASKRERESWGELIGAYLGCGRVRHLFLLLDCRHAPSDEDRQMLQWTIYYGVPYTIVATKCDKLPRAKRAVSANAAASQLGAPPYAIPFSSRSNEGRDELIARIGQIAADCARAANRTNDTK